MSHGLPAGEGGRFNGVPITDPAFAGDLGEQDAALGDALAAYTRGAVDDYVVIGALAGTRVMVPVVAVLDESEVVDGHMVEKSSHMASVSIIGPDGRRALLAFTSMSALRAWDAEARPVLTVVEAVALSALAEEADAVVVDIAGPVPYAIEGPALRAMATGRAWVPPSQDEDIKAAIVASLAGLTADGWVDVRLEDGGDDADLIVVMVLADRGHPDGRSPARIVEQAAALLQNVPILRERLVRGLALGYDIPG